MKKNVYEAHEITVGSERHTRYDVDVDKLTEECDWKDYKRMELNPGDTIHLSDGSILKVVEDDVGEETCDACALTWGFYEKHKIWKSKEVALCLMCDCGEFRKDAPCVHLEEV